VITTKIHTTLKQTILAVTLCFLSSFGYGQLNLTTSSTDNYQCDGVNCEYDGPSILINEVQMAPTRDDGSFYEPAPDRQGEWIELYNPDECKSIDISCYYLGNAATDGNITASGGFIIPTGTIVPPLGFVVIRGQNAPNVPAQRLIANGGDTYEFTTSANNSCIGTGGTRLWFPNAGGWFAFYDQNGVPQDAIRWGNPPAVDLRTAPCKATSSGCGFTGNLLDYNSIIASRKNTLQNNAVNASQRTFQRNPDGGNWRATEGTSSIGTCNQQCVPIQTISCNGTVTVNPINGRAPYLFVWNDSRAQSTKTANGLCAGTYCVNVTDADGKTGSACVVVKNFVPTVTLIEDGDLCEDEPSFPLTGGSPAGGINGSTGTYSGPGVSGTTFNPASANIGDNEIEYVYVDSATCTDTATAIITVHPLPTTQANADKEKICLGESVTLFGTGADNYSWNHGVMDNVPFSPTETKMYVLTGTTSFGCILLDSILIEVSFPMEAGVGDTATICPEEEFFLTDILNGYDINGRWEALESPAANLDALTGSLTNTDNLLPGTYNFHYIVEPDAPCLNDTATVTLLVPDKPEIADVDAICKLDRTGYIVTFTIENGDSSTYNVSYPGSITSVKPYVYTSDLVPSNTAVTFYANDGQNCGLDSALTDLDCSCITDPGTMSRNPVNICGLLAYDATNDFNNDSINDGNDAFWFYLHDGNANALVNPHDSNQTGIFNFDPNTMNFGQTYYVSTAMADALSNDGLDYSDVCFLVSAGTPVSWNPLPELSIAAIDTICSANPAYNLQVNVQVGSFPINLTIEETPVAGPPIQNTTSIVSTTSNIPYSPQVTTTYNVVNYIDNKGCVGTNFPPSIQVVVDKPIEVDISATNTPSCASPTNPGSITLFVDGEETTFWVVVKNSLNSVLDTFQVNNQTPSNFPVTHFTANAATVYEIHDVFANEKNVCTPIFRGQAIINPTPTATISKDGVYCQIDPIPFDFTFTGIGPWEVVISDGGSNSFTFTTPDDTPTYTGIIINQLQPDTYAFTITSVRDLSSGCTNAGGTGTSNIIVNPSPILDLFVLDANGNRAKNHAYCLGDGPATLEVDGFPDPTVIYNMTYKIVGPPDIAYPELQISDGNAQFNFDTLVAGTYNIFIARVTDNSSAGCGGFGDTVSITIHPLPTLFLNVIDQTICLGQPAEIEATVGTNPPVSFDLTEGTGLDPTTYNISGTNTFRFTVTPTQTGAHRYFASNLKDGSLPQCSNTTSAFVDIYVNQLPTATINGAGDWCEGTAFQIPVKATGEDSVDVVFDLGGVSTLSQRIGLFDKDTISAILPVGTHTINITSVIDKTPEQCVGTGFGPFIVTVQPTPSAIINYNPDPVCLNEGVEVIFSASGNGPFEIDYINDISDMGTVIVNSTQAVVTDIARMGMNYTITEIRDGTNPSDHLNYCQSNPNSVFSPIVNELPTAVISGDDKICRGETANLLFSFTGLSAFDFSLTDNFGNQSHFSQENSPFSHGVTPDSTSTYSITQLTDANGCVGVDLGSPFLVTVFDNPEPVFLADPPTSCAPLNTSLLNLTSNVTLSNCQINSGTNNSFSCDSIQSGWVFDQAGSYNLNYSLTSTDGCNTSGTIDSFFTAYSNPIADFIWNPYRPTTVHNTLQITNKSTEADSSYWEINDQQFLIDIVTNDRHPVVNYSFKSGNEFTVYLYVETVNGCKDSIIKTIEVKEKTPVYIPNAFTPNGDGVNEGFRSVFDYASSKEFLIEIYNRWGERLFTSDNPEEYWDGIYRQIPAKPDVYIVKVTVTFDYSDVEQTFNAKVTLVR
jgi:gliding motility-associated-like protein